MAAASPVTARRREIAGTPDRGRGRPVSRDDHEHRVDAWSHTAVTLAHAGTGATLPPTFTPCDAK